MVHAFVYYFDRYVCHYEGALQLSTDKPVLRGHLWDKGEVVFQDR
jgi:hypothetical protein